eukprot:scaffold70103_cov84-Phaeocystis_antarctica.AAC.2
MRAATAARRRSTAYAVCYCACCVCCATYTLAALAVPAALAARAARVLCLLASSGDRAAAHQREAVRLQGGIYCTVAAVPPPLLCVFSASADEP